MQTIFDTSEAAHRTRSEQAPLLLRKEQSWWLQGTCIPAPPTLSSSYNCLLPVIDKVPKYINSALSNLRARLHDHELKPRENLWCEDSSEEPQVFTPTAAAHNPIDHLRLASVRPSHCHPQPTAKMSNGVHKTNNPSQRTKNMRVPNNRIELLTFA